MQPISRMNYLLYACITTFIFIPPTFAMHASYTSSEHLSAGDEVKIFFNKNDTGQQAHWFQLPNGLQLSYGDIVTFGDFYGDPEKAIILGETSVEREVRFRNAFEMFARKNQYVSEATQLIAVVHHEQEVVLDAIEKGESPESVYSRVGNETGRELNCITGGGCSTDTWWLEPGRFLQLAKHNFDHFGQYALTVYKIGHQIALQRALAASKTHDMRKLEIAYAINAFASHFLADRFSAGHLRTPRKELSDDVTPETTGAILSNYMHNEENFYGVHAHNLRGNHWISYGDQSYFSNRNNLNRILLNEALQSSADHIFSTYLSGTITSDYATLSIVPYADETGYVAHHDISQLFYFDTEKNALMRRSDTANVYDRNWTSDWWGWSTLIQLKHERGMPSVDQRQLALSSYKDKAIQDGLITDKDILDAVRRK